MIREIHGNVDLRKHVGALERLLTDLIKTSKPKKADSDKKQKDAISFPPSVNDYVDFLRRNRYMLFDYLHDVAKGCPELRETWRSWAKEAVSAFRHDEFNASAPNEKVHNTSETVTQGLSAGRLDMDLQKVFDLIPVEKRGHALAEVDAHAEYLQKLEEISEGRMQRILSLTPNAKPGVDPTSGPGSYLSQWESLLDNTPVTPVTKQGPLRSGKDIKGLRALGKTESMTSKDIWDSATNQTRDEPSYPQAPGAKTLISHLGPMFKTLVAEMSLQGLLSSDVD